MNSLKRCNPLIGMTQVAVLTLLWVPSILLAQNDFRVMPMTGLETESGAPKLTGSKKPKQSVAPVVEKKATEITCSGETVFDAKAGMAMFVKEVKVSDPQFNLSADKLTAYLKKAVKETEKKETPDAKTEEKADGKVDAKSDAKLDAPASGLERAVAEGNVIISQDKVDEKSGEVTHYIGKGAKADYNAVSGEMTLSGWPQLQQGMNTQVATEEGTVMIMNREGHLRTVGRSKTVIQADAKPAKAEKPEKQETAKSDLLKVP